MPKRALFESEDTAREGFLMTGDLNVEFGSLCMEDDDELKEISTGRDALMVLRQFSEGSKKAMWLEMQWRSVAKPCLLNWAVT